MIRRVATIVLIPLAFLASIGALGIRTATPARPVIVPPVHLGPAAGGVW